MSRSILPTLAHVAAQRTNASAPARFNVYPACKENHSGPAIGSLSGKKTEDNLVQPRDLAMAPWPGALNETPHADVDHQNSLIPAVARCSLPS